MTDDLCLDFTSDHSSSDLYSRREAFLEAGKLLSAEKNTSRHPEAPRFFKRGEGPPLKVVWR